MNFTINQSSRFLEADTKFQKFSRYNEGYKWHYFRDCVKDAVFDRILGLDAGQTLTETIKYYNRKRRAIPCAMTVRCFDTGERMRNGKVKKQYDVDLIRLSKGTTVDD